MLSTQTTYLRLISNYNNNSKISQTGHQGSIFERTWIFNMYGFLLVSDSKALICFITWFSHLWITKFMPKFGFNAFQYREKCIISVNFM